MSLQTIRNTFSQAVDAAVRALYSTYELNTYTELFGKELATEYEPDVPADQISTLSGPGRGTLTLEGQPYAANSRYKGYPMSLTLRKFTSELSWSEEALHFLKKAPTSKRAMEVNSMVEGAVNALFQNWNEEMAKVIYLGFGTTNLTGGDAVALFSEAHPTRKSGVGNQANTFGSGDTHRAFSAANLVELLNKMNRAKDHNGVQFKKVRRFRVICSTELHPTVQQAIESMYGPLTANLGTNTASREMLSGRGMVDVGITVLPDIPYAYRNYWAVVDLDRAAKMSFRGVAWRPRMNDVNKFENGTFLNEASTLFGHLWNHWAWIFGSKGDGTSIS